MKININEERFNGENFVLDKERGVEGTLAWKESLLRYKYEYLWLFLKSN